MLEILIKKMDLNIIKFRGSQTSFDDYNRIYTIDPTLFKKFREVATKDMRKMSNIIERSIVRYISSKQ